MSQSKKYDVAIIGSGPGGEGAAINLAKHGLKVVLIERFKEVGGGCTHWGTIPSKALRHSVARLNEYNASPLFSDGFKALSLTFKDILQHAKSVIGEQVRLKGGYYDRNRVDVVYGAAAFESSSDEQLHLRVALDDGTEEKLIAGKVLLATGSRPYHPLDVDFDHPRVYDSDSILSLEHNPRTIIIYGAGVIGSEYASIFRGLGVKVDLVNTRDRLLAYLDQEISEALSYHLWNSGVVIRNNEEYDRIEGQDDGVVVYLKSGKKMRADCILYANGRTGNTDSLALDNVGLSADSRGQLKVDHCYRTENPNIYAVGDVIGYPSLASAAFDQGRIAAQNMIDGSCHIELVSDIPTGIYTIPEISSVGKNEQELTAEKVPYEVGRAQFRSLARGQIADTKVGCLKLLFHRETKEILGIHCFGERASEIIHIGQAIMMQKKGGNTIEYFAHTTFNYPTMAEAYRVAALNGLNRLF